MKTKSEQEKEAAKARYEELLAALEVAKMRFQNVLFEITPSQARFDEIYNNNTVSPFHVEFKSKNTGATFTLENKFFPHGWVLYIPKNATKEEKECMLDIMLETIANPKDAPEGYEPALVAWFHEDTPEDEIFEFVKAAQEKGITVNLFIGNESDYDKIINDHKKKTEDFIAAGNLEKLPGWDGLMNNIHKSAGGIKGEEMMEKYSSEHTPSPSRF